MSAWTSLTDFCKRHFAGRHSRQTSTSGEPDSQQLQMVANFRNHLKYFARHTSLKDYSTGTAIELFPHLALAHSNDQESLLAVMMLMTLIGDGMKEWIKEALELTVADQKLNFEAAIRMVLQQKQATAEKVLADTNPPKFRELHGLKDGAMFALEAVWQNLSWYQSKNKQPLSDP